MAGFGDNFPTAPVTGDGNATKLNGMPVPAPTVAGSVLEYTALGLEWTTSPAPGPHAPTHAAGGTDPVSLDMSQVPTGQLSASRIAGGAVSDTEYGYLDGVTSSIQTQLNGKQASDADLTALAALSGTGLSTRTAANTWTTRSVAQGTGITVTNGDGVAGNPTVALTNSSLTVSAGTGLTGGGSVALGGTTTISAGTELAGLSGLAATGLVARTAAGTYASRTLTQPAAGLTVSNGGGGAGNPTLALANDLAAVEGLASTGIAVRTATDTWATRTLTGPAAGITVSSGDGVAGNPTLALANDLSALEALASTGLAVRTTTDTWAQRSIAQGTGITVTNGDGVSGNPTVAIDSTVVTLTGAQTLSNKTLSAPTLSGTASGTYSLGGTPSLGAALNANGFKITSLGAPASSTDAARMDYVVSTVCMATATDPTTTGFWFYGVTGPMTQDPTVVVPFIVPYNGTIDAMYWQSNNAAPAACKVDIRKGANTTPPYLYNLAVRLTPAMGDTRGNSGVGLTVSAGDTFIIAYGDFGVQWNHGGFTVSFSLRRS